MKLVFCGTPHFAVPSLERLVNSGFDVRLVVSQPDRRKGRGMELTAPPVKQTANALSLPVVQPENIRSNPEFQQQLSSLDPDAIIVVAYGRIIPPWMLQLPKFGNINVHASLLPKYRGAAPIQWAIASGERVTGVTTMRIDEGLDTGDILLKREFQIEPEDTAVTLSPRLAAVGAELLVETLPGLETGTVQPLPQENAQATQAPLLKKEDGLIDFARSSVEIYNRLRGFQPWPGAYTHFRGKSLKIVAARPSQSGPSIALGELHGSGDRLFAGCGSNTTLELLTVQPEGRKPVSPREFINGYRPAMGEHLG
ncbi:MAG: methionyl-tRNA formyltransferase [Candidatus Angelobacter sp.]